MPPFGCQASRPTNLWVRKARPSPDGLGGDQARPLLAGLDEEAVARPEHDREDDHT